MAHVRHIRIVREWKRSVLALGKDRLSTIAGRDCDCETSREEDELLEAGFGLMPLDPSMWDIQICSLAVGTIVVTDDDSDADAPDEFSIGNKFREQPLYQMFID